MDIIGQNGNEGEHYEIEEDEDSDVELVKQKISGLKNKIREREMNK